MNSIVKGINATLAQQQSRFVAKVLNAPTHSGPFKHGEGFSVYRRNLHAVAEAALSVTYPTARRLLGEIQFQTLVDQLLVLHPPKRGDWGTWGEAFPVLIARSEPGRKFPFTAPIAELDWLRHRANRAPDTRFDPSTVNLLKAHPVDEIGIAIAHHVGITRSIYPLIDILDWHAEPAVAGEQLQVSDSPRPVLVYRREFRVDQSYISPADYRFLRGLRDGRSLGSLLDELNEQGFDFQRWIERATTQNLISHLYLI